LELVVVVTPLEQEVLDALVVKLRADGVSEEIITGLTNAFQADRLPTADEIAALIKSESGDKTA
jgi:hypothetical protein